LAESGKLNESECLFDPKLRALSQIIEENKPDGFHVVVPDVAARIDAIVAEVTPEGTLPPVTLRARPELKRRVGIGIFAGLWSGGLRLGLWLGRLSRGSCCGC
jgi:hypothetical protein